MRKLWMWRAESKSEVSTKLELIGYHWNGMTCNDALLCFLLATFLYTPSGLITYQLVHTCFTFALKSSGVRANINRPYFVHNSIFPFVRSLFSCSTFTIPIHVSHSTGYYIIICVEVCFYFINNKFHFAGGLTILLLLFSNLLHLFTRFRLWWCLLNLVSAPVTEIIFKYWNIILFPWLNVNLFAMVADDVLWKIIKFMLLILSERNIIWIPLSYGCQNVISFIVH